MVKYYLISGYTHVFAGDVIKLVELLSNYSTKMYLITNVTGNIK